MGTPFSKGKKQQMSKTTLKFKKRISLFRTSWPNSIKLGTNHPSVKETQHVQTKGQVL
jgi:hypothetical protein